MLYLHLFQDRYAVDRVLPPIDSSQDWFLVSGEEENGITVLEFTRNLTSCDDKDLNIEVEKNLHEFHVHTLVIALFASLASATASMASLDQFTSG